MSTRSAIARPHGGDGGWEGRYHHWDGYPTALGATLFGLYHGHFQQDVVAMQKFLIDDHPGGWSTINGTDFNLEPGFIERNYDGNDSTSNRPQCYCHGDRHEEGGAPMICAGSNQHGDNCTGEQCDPLFIEWAYVLGPEGMAIYAGKPRGSEEDSEKIWQETGSYGGAYQHVLLASVAWSDTPDWEAIENSKYPEEVEV